MNFDIIALSESRIKKNAVSPINIELKNYSIEHTPTKIAAGGVLLYINKRLSYHLRNDLNIYTPGKLESIFIEIVCPKSCNIIFFFNWYPLHARLNSHYEAWSYKEKKHKKVKAYRKPL